MVLFTAVAAEQIGVPIPAGPVLIAAGALAGLHRMSLPAALSSGGRGLPVQRFGLVFPGTAARRQDSWFFCRVSLEPDTCVSNMQSFYSRYGPKSLLFAKFVPGLGALGPPMAGAVHLGGMEVLFARCRGSPRLVRDLFRAWLDIPDSIERTRPSSGGIWRLSWLRLSRWLWCFISVSNTCSGGESTDHSGSPGLRLLT